MRFFNTAGPVRATDHYCIPPLERFELEDILLLIQQQKYFVLHAPRQTGKTSSLLALVEYLNTQGEYCSVYMNVELAQAAREDVGAAMQAILSQLASRVRIILGEHFVEKMWIEVLEQSGPYAAFEETLSRWAAHASKPIVLCIDEIDSLIGDTLISVLRQLRAGYDKRPQHFPHSVILCGVRDVRDYRIHSASEKAIITGGSAFNIKAESLRLGPVKIEFPDLPYLVIEQGPAQDGDEWYSSTGDRPRDASSSASSSRRQRPFCRSRRGPQANGLRPAGPFGWLSRGSIPTSSRRSARAGRPN